MRGQITTVSVNGHEDTKEEKGNGKSKIPIFQQVEESQEEKGKGVSVISGSIAATMVLPRLGFLFFVLFCFSLNLFIFLLLLFLFFSPNLFYFLNFV